MGKDYIPISDAEFDRWLRNLSKKLPSIATAIGVPQALIDKLVAAYADWRTAYTANQKIHNEAKGATETKNEKRVNAKSIARLLVGVLQAFPDLTDAQREILDITVRDTTPTPISPEYVMEIDPPLLKLDLRSGQVTIHFGVNPGNEHENAKPENIAGVKLWYRVGGAEWEWLGYDTNSPYRHNIDLGEALEYRAQWLDKKMRTGRFSMVAQATVTVR